MLSSINTSDLSLLPLFIDGMWLAYYKPMHWSRKHLLYLKKKKREKEKKGL